MGNDNRPIGIFDSGIGGLTVFSAIREKIPDESLIYLGDTARVPYGTKSAETIIKYAGQNANFLMKQDVKAIVIACNTVSAWALEDLQRSFSIPIIGVIEPGARQGLSVSRNRRIGVIATRATVDSRAYQKTIEKNDPSAFVVSKACPLFVPIVEEGMQESQIANIVVKEYLDDLIKNDVDTLILGCTHYPMLSKTIKKYIGNDVNIVDSSFAVARELGYLFSTGVILKSSSKGADHIYVTDLPSHFENIASRFLNFPVPNVTRIDI